VVLDAGEIDRGGISSSKGAVAVAAAGDDSGNIPPIDGGVESESSMTSTHPSLGSRPYTPSLPNNSSEASVDRDTDCCMRKDSTDTKPYLHQLRGHGDVDGHPPTTRNARVERVSRALGVVELDWAAYYSYGCVPDGKSGCYSERGGRPICRRRLHLIWYFFEKKSFDFGFRPDLVG
jgi:hypothetical protein